MARFSIALTIWSLRAGIYMLALGAGVGIGFLYNQLSRHVEVALLFPLLAGLLAGAILRLAAHAGRLSFTKHALLAGLLAGALAYGSSFWFDYGEFRADLSRVGGVSGALSTTQVDRVETELLGTPGLPAYLNARARYGGRAVGVRGTGSARLSADLQWLVWLGEIMLAASAGGAVASYAAPRRDRSVHFDRTQLASVTPGVLGQNGN
jgi:hypothetical protein